MAYNNENTYSHLEELGDSDYEIADNQPNVTGWEVKDARGETIGEVEELLFDPQARKVRYLVVNPENNTVEATTHYHVLIPIGVADLHESDDEVILAALTVAQLNALPPYEKGALTPETEVAIRSILDDQGINGETSATAAYSADDFFAHPHFNDEHFYRPKPTDDSLYREVDPNRSVDPDHH